MLFTHPPGYSAGAPNRQVFNNLGSPTTGQSQLGTGTGQGPLGGQGLSGGGLQSSSASNSMLGTAPYTPPTMLSPNAAPPGMNRPPTMQPYVNSPNQSTLLRVLLGNTRKV